MDAIHSDAQARLRCAGLALLLGMGWLFLLYFGLRLSGLPTARLLGEVLLGADPLAADLFPFPFTIQSPMWLVFGIGLGELYQRYYASRREENALGYRLLPEDDSTILVADELGALYRRMREQLADNNTFLYRLIQRIIFQFQSSRSIDQANSLLNSSLELFNHEVDLRYGLLRYLIWLIPTLGFMGTIIGIALALEYAGSADFQDPDLLSKVSSRLAVAFNTTLLALMLSAVLVFLLHIIQTHEERVLNRIGQYCLDNLINRLYVSD